MDISMKWYEDPTYIKMADCPEIQGQRDGTTPDTEWREGDTLCQQLIIGPQFKVFTEYEWERESWFGSYLWLPDQSQLLEMLGGRGLQTLCNQMYEWSIGGGAQFTILGGSMEQLTIAFVMKELHNKVWNDGWK